MTAHPPDGGVSEDAPLEKQLRARITALLERIFDEESAEFAFLYKEFANPTGLLDEVMEKAINPLRQAMAKIVQELMGKKASIMDIHFCQVSIVSQCMGIMFGKRLIPSHQSHQMFTTDIIEKLADHIATFSLAGIGAVKNKKAAKKKRKKK